MTDFENIIRDYWPFIVVAVWFIYKQWNSNRVIKMLPSLRSQGAIEIDVRSIAEFSQDNAVSTINIPLNELGTSLNKISRKHPVVLCCASGTRSGMAKMLLLKNGYKNVYNVGAWTNLIKP